MLAPAAIMYDCDGVLNNAQGENPTTDSPFIVDQDGYMGGTIIGLERLKKITQFCITHHIPLYIITARPERHRGFLEGLVENLNGFHTGVGGFKRENIHCLGIEEYNEQLGRLAVKSLIVEKWQRIQEIHSTNLSHLPKNHILFIEDKWENLEPVMKKGYATIQAQVGREEHHQQTLNFLSALIDTPFVSTQGNYAVLTKPTELDMRRPLDNTEFLEAATTAELDGWYWRKRLVPDMSTLADMALRDAQKREKTAQDLSSLQCKQMIFFTDTFDLIQKRMENCSFGTLSSIEELKKKKFIILVGSEGKRKIEPLKKALSDSGMDLKDLVIVGLPADSGVACQPVGHEEILLGCQNRLKQVLCFEQGIKQWLDQTYPKHQITIVSITIENGIGLFPVDSVEENGTLRLAKTPLTSQNNTKFHFYDQAHLLFHCEKQTVHHVAKPAQIEYILTGNELEELMAYFNDGKPKETYYLKQSEWSYEMITRSDSSNPNSALPFRHESGHIFSSDDLIQEALYNFFNFTFKQLMSNLHNESKDKLTSLLKQVGSQFMPKRNQYLDEAVNIEEQQQGLRFSEEEDNIKNSFN